MRAVRHFVDVESVGVEAVLGPVRGESLQTVDDWEIARGLIVQLPNRAVHEGVEDALGFAVLAGAVAFVRHPAALGLAEGDDGKVDDVRESVSVPGGPELVLDELGGVRTEALHVHLHSHGRQIPPRLQFHPSITTTFQDCTPCLISTRASRPKLRSAEG